MYRFTKGKEMEELEELFKKGKIKEFIKEERCVKVKISTVTAFGCISWFDHYCGYYAGRYIDWEETAKLVKHKCDCVNHLSFMGLIGTQCVLKCDNCGDEYTDTEVDSMEIKELNKEDKMEKVIVRGWEDLEEYNSNMTEKEWVECGFKIFKFNDVEFETNSIQKAVNIFNTLGGNFKYKPIEAIDTFPKFREFLTNKCLTYKPWQSGHEIYCKENLINYRIKEIEVKFNVDLQMLK